MARSPIESLYLGGQAAEYKKAWRDLSRKSWICFGIGMLGFVGMPIGVILDEPTIILPSTLMFFGGLLLTKYCDMKRDKLQVEIKQVANSLKE